MHLLRSAAMILGSKKLRPWLAGAILVLTVALVARFFVVHPDYLSELRNVRPWAVIAVILLNIPMVALLVWIYDATLRLCGKRLPLKENILLTSYSSIINFFGPLQSGPGVRAFYLKTRHKVRLRDYVLATLIYYGIFAFFSALFLLVGTRPWWQTLLALLLVAAFSALVIRWFIKRDKKRGSESHFALRGAALASLIVATFLQVVLTAITYFVELRAVNPEIHLSQAISYAGAANFALFVSITPDAIGFREAFLVFSQHLHHVTTANILGANIIDRGAYLIFLILLFIVVISVHAQGRLRLKGWRRQAAAKSGQ